jgi:hypothetical protein
VFAGPEPALTNRPWRKNWAAVSESDLFPTVCRITGEMAILRQLTLYQKLGPVTSFALFAKGKNAELLVDQDWSAYQTTF